MSRTIIVGACVMACIGAGFIGVEIFRSRPTHEPTLQRIVKPLPKISLNDNKQVILPASHDPERTWLLTPGINEEAGHEILVGLVAEARAGLVLDLAAISMNVSHAPGWRNYAIQHLATHYELHGDAASVELLCDVASTGDVHVRPIAIYSLARLATGRRPNLGAEAQTAVLSGLIAVDASVREAALRSAGLLGMEEALPSARAALSDSKTTIALAMAAVDFIGLRGSPEDVSILERESHRLAQTGDVGVLAKAIQRALLRIRSGATNEQRAGVASGIVGLK